MMKDDDIIAKNDNDTLKNIDVDIVNYAFFIVRILLICWWTTYIFTVNLYLTTIKSTTICATIFKLTKPIISTNEVDDNVTSYTV